MRPASIVLAIGLGVLGSGCNDVLGLGPPRTSWPAEAGLDTGAPPATNVPATVTDAGPADSAPAGGGPDSGPPGDAQPLPVDGSASSSPVETPLSAVGFVTGATTPVTATRAAAANFDNELLAAQTLSCTGVLVGAHTAITAASCLASDPKATYFGLNPIGDAGGHPERTVIYGVDAVHLGPNGQAVLHLAVGSDQPEPSSLATPLLTMTGTDGAPSPFGWHSSLPADALLRTGSGDSQMVAWEVEGPATIVRRTQSGSATLMSDVELDVAPTSTVAPSATHVGAPVLAPTAGVVVGFLYQETAISMSFRPTFGADESAWLELFLWLYDEQVVPGVAPLLPGGDYTWIRVAMPPQDPATWMNTPPATYFPAGSEGNNVYGICTTWTNAAQIPGKYWTGGGCAFDDNGNESWPAAEKILVVSTTATWQAADGGVPVPGSFVTGYTASGLLLPECRGSYMSGVDPGYVRDGTCHVTWGGSEQILSSFETVILGK